MKWRAARLPAPGDAQVPARQARIPAPARSIAPPGSGALKGEVTHREFLGADIRYGVRVIGTDEILVESPFQSGSDLHAVGDTVGIALPPERALYLAA